jgi:Flp pilus assembly pilin Flp
VNVAPLTVEQILATPRRDRSLLVGYLLESLILVARKLWPEFAPRLTREPLSTSEDVSPRAEPEPKPRRRPFWIHRRDEEGQSLAEYALILALIAIVAIVAVLFLGTQISAMLSSIGESI